MADDDAIVLRDIQDSVAALDMRYRMADINAKRSLRPSLDEAYDKFTLARLKLLADGSIVTDRDIVEMARIKNDIEAAAETQMLIVAAARLVGFLGRIALA